MTKRYWWILITYVLALYSVLAIAPLLYLITPLDQIEASVYGNMLSFILGLIAMLWILKPEMQMRNVDEDAATTNQVVLWSIIGIAMAFMSQAIAINIEIHVFNIRTTSENTALIMDITRQIPIFAVITAIVAPILEEIVFRKILFGTLYKHMNFFFAGLISALIFGFVHGEPIHILIYASMGFVFAFLYVKTKRIIVPIIVHMAMNGITVLMQYSLTPEDIEKMQRMLEEMQILIGG